MPASKGRVKNVRDVAADEMILDIGPETAALYAERLEGAGTIVWNGPLGVFEHPEFAAGTRRVAEADRGEQGVLDRGRRRHARGHRAVRRRRQISYISTGGGAFLEFLEGKTLPAVATLERRAAGG